MVQKILDLMAHPIDFQTKWAVCEDVIYSYQLSQNYRMSVVCDARAYHNEPKEKLNFRKAIFYGRSSVIMRYYFVSLYNKFNKLAFY